MNGNSTTNTTSPASLVSRSSTGPRRPSLSTTLSHNPNHHNHNFVSSPLTPTTSSTSLNSSTNSNLYHPPYHYNSQSGGGGGSNGGVNGPRSYSREEMLNIYKSMPSVALEKGLQDLLKRIVDGDGAGGGKDILAEVCWVENGVIGPVALEEMTAEEREVSSLRFSRCCSGLFSLSPIRVLNQLHSSSLETSTHRKSNPPWRKTTRIQPKVVEPIITTTTALITIRAPIPLALPERVLGQWESTPTAPAQAPTPKHL